jgi:hypothetical protein
LAAELWDVDVRIGSLRQRRAALLAQLRAGTPTPPASAADGPAGAVTQAPGAVTQAPGGWTSVPAGGVAAGGPPPVWAAPQRKEWTPQRTQNALLSLGVLLLAVAALVATAVAYRQVGAAGRAGVLLVVTALAVATSEITRRRGLTATGEATAALSVVLALVSARALRRAGLGDEVSAESFWTAATALVAVGSAVLARSGARAFGIGAVLVGQVPLLITASRQDGAAVSGVLTLQVALLVVADVVLRQWRRAAVELRPILLASAGLTTWVAAGIAIEAAFPDSGNVRGGVVALCALSAVLVASSFLLTELGAVGRHLLTATATCLAVVALAAPARMAFSDDELAVVVAVAGLLVALAVALLPDAWRLGPAIAAVAASVAALIRVVPAVSQAALWPFSWLGDPWARPPGASARDSLIAGDRWQGQSEVAAVMVLAAATSIVLAALARRVRWASYPVVVLATLAVLVTPLAVDTTYAVALSWDLAVGAALVVLGPAVRRRSLAPGYACSGIGLAVLVLASAWSVGDERASTVVLGLAAVVCAVAAWLDGLLDAALSPVFAGVAAVLLGGEVFAVARSAGNPLDRSGFVLAVAGAVLVVVLGYWRPRTSDGMAVEVVSWALIGAGLVAASGDAGWTSWTFALAGLTALTSALRPERRPMAYVASLLLAASSWVRLVDADVHAPEPYVVPLATVALGLGLLRRRADRGVSSWTAYGPALSLALVPSLIASLDDSSARRPLLLAVAATAVVVIGAVRRLQAPFVVGGAVLAVDAVRQLGAYVALLPRWVVIGFLGLVLLGLGMTFEQRRRDVQRAQQAFERMS